MPSGPPIPPVADAMKKAAVVWLAVADNPPRLVWTLWLDDAAYVVHGPGEQQVPGLETAKSCTVTARTSDGQAAALTWVAAVSQVTPGTAEWDAVLPTLVGKRLNLSEGGVEHTVQRWAASCVVSRLAAARVDTATLDPDITLQE